MRRTGLYSLIFIACLAGLAWTAYLMQHPHLVLDEQVTPCVIKHVTGIPCPSCGSSRSVISLVRGDVANAMYWNPFGLIIFSIMLVSPVWIGYDVATKRDTFLTSYRRAERILRIKWVAISAIALVTINWIWNITKEL
jgi:hypothetical protein